MTPRRVAVTGIGAITACGISVDAAWAGVTSRTSALGPITRWDVTGWPRRIAGEVVPFDARALVADRKLHKYLRRRDFFGLYAADQAIDDSAVLAPRQALDAAARERFSDRSAVWVGSGGGSYADQYDFLPALAGSAGDAAAFARAVESSVTPMWLLQSLPNNVLCHVGIRHDLKGPNGCFTSHSVSGIGAIAAGAASITDGDADRAVVVAHDAPVEPEVIARYHALGLLSAEQVRPFDTRRDGTVLGEGAGALVLEHAEEARARGARVLGEILGSGQAAEDGGLLDVREDGDAVARAIGAALEDAALTPDDVGMIVAHANGTRASDASEARALARVFGADGPPITGFKWAFGHLLAGSGAVESALALCALRARVVPAIPTLREPDEAAAGLAICRRAVEPRTDVALVVSRGFAGTAAALLLRAPARW
ncbi:MAG: 3-oxoacyl-[acyl-carrier-protein] synthase [Candidatus Binatota bacterium]|nr:3-oxoacyl-[acyl-carrier-protein] synthase [Candidatus Binatota bacterium]